MTDVADIAMASQEKYKSLFPDDASKAAAFDKIAELYYFGNFGSTPKADLDVLMFSLYIDRILAQSEEDMHSYSDYTLSKQLGITQQRISSLKVKKELKYPNQGFQWKKSFCRILENARYVDGRIRLYIPDKNLFLEIKNAVEMSNGYIDLQLNSSLLVIEPQFFVDLALCVCEEGVRANAEAQIRKIVLENSSGNDYIGKKTFGEILKGMKNEILLQAMRQIPLVGTFMADFLKDQL